MSVLGIKLRNYVNLRVITKKYDRILRSIMKNIAV